MDTEHWLTSQRTIDKSKKQYAHFDYRTDIGSQRAYISDPEKIAEHGFYPFIHYQQIMDKYSKNSGKKKKIRDICYAAHIDRCIYQYYNFILNELYNKRIRADGISSVAVAYRTDLHKSNIHFAKEAIAFMKACTSCYVMIGDFTGFFDHLDHVYLKKQWCSLLGVSHLPENHYALFKNITRYSKWELTDLLVLNNLENNRKDRKSLNAMLRVLTPEQYKNNRSKIIPNSNAYGIPQGSPISALLANVYMLDIDKEVNNLVTSLQGLYMRYSDDFIIVLPNLDEKVAVHELSRITSLFNNTPGLSLQPDKTQYFKYADSMVENCGTAFHAAADCQKRFINFLGFTFDGNRVSIRSKTTTKYYYRMYRKAKTIAACGGYTSGGKHISGKNLYDRYSIRGADGKKGNYLTYVSRAKSIFGPSEAIERDTRRHMQKIRKALKRS